MAQLFEIVEGWTEELPAMTLKVNGAIVDLTGKAVELRLHPLGGGPYVTIAGTTRVDNDPTTGKVYYKPAATDLSAAKSPYAIHWKVTDGVGDVVFHPNVAADTIAVNKP